MLSVDYAEHSFGPDRAKLAGECALDRTESSRKVALDVPANGRRHLVKFAFAKKGQRRLPIEGGTRRGQPDPRGIAVIEMRGDAIQPVERLAAVVELGGGKDIAALGPLPADDAPSFQPVVNGLAGLETGAVGKFLRGE